MSAYDVWRTIDRHISVFSKGNFDQVPPKPGVYAWFYPLRVTTVDLAQMINEFRLVHLFDSLVNAPPNVSAEIMLAWRTVRLSYEELHLSPQIPDTFQKLWATLVDDAKQFSEFRQALMAASILMPPLYVGKTIDLKSRCSQHRNTTATDGSTFRSRYEEYALAQNLSITSIDELLFACIEAGDEKNSHNIENPLQGSESLLEEILKRIAAPPFSKR